MKNKQRTRKSVAKRFKVTKTGKVLYRSQGKRHLKATKSKRQLRSLKTIKQMKKKQRIKILKMLGKK
jgi:large subunit ribosomal protein L35